MCKKGLEKVLAEVVEQARTLIAGADRADSYCEDCREEHKMVSTLYWDNSAGRYGVLKQLCERFTCPNCGHYTDYDLGRGCSVMVRGRTNHF